MIKRENLGFFLIGIGLIICLIFTFFGNFIHTSEKLNPEILSKYGGFIGGTVGSIFSLAGFLIIYESFRLQKRQLFESTFFNLFDQFNVFRYDKIGLIVKKDNDENYERGHVFFQTIFKWELGLSSEDSTTSIEKVKSVFDLHKSEFNRFFGHVNMIVYHIESNSDLRNKEQDFYYSYLLSQLSGQEKFLIYFYKNHENSQNYFYLSKLILRDVEDYKKYFK